MFDISFTELMAISVIALLVIGPEKLPKLARMAGAFTGRVQKMVAQVKEEVNREVRFEELQQLQQEMAEAGADVTNSIHAETNELQSIVNDIDQRIDQVAQAEPKSQATSKPEAKTEKATAEKKVTRKKAAVSKSVSTKTAVKKTASVTAKRTGNKSKAVKKVTTKS